MSERRLPVWDERQRPDTLIESGEGEACRVVPGYQGEGDDFADWANQYRTDMQQELRRVHPLTAARLDTIGVDLRGINLMVADIAGRSPYPLHRFVTDTDIAVSPVYQDAAEAGFFTAGMTVDGEPVDAQAVELMDFVRLSGEFIVSSPYDKLTRVLAHDTGHAVLQRHVRVQIDRKPDADAEWYIWSGNVWKQQGQYYGYLLNEAGAERLAADCSREIGLLALSGGDLPDVVKPYQSALEHQFAVSGAVILDTINQANGQTDALAIYYPLWRLCDFDDEAARLELSAMVRRATSGEVSLEDLDAIYMHDNLAALSLLERIEEACGIDISRRASQVLR